jgi:hypothetical protein
MYIKRCLGEIAWLNDCGFELKGFLSFLYGCEHHEPTSRDMPKAPTSLARCWGF